VLDAHYAASEKPNTEGDVPLAQQERDPRCYGLKAARVPGALPPVRPRHSALECSRARSVAGGQCVNIHWLRQRRRPRTGPSGLATTFKPMTDGEQVQENSWRGYRAYAGAGKVEKVKTPPRCSTRGTRAAQGAG